MDLSKDANLTAALGANLGTLATARNKKNINKGGVSITFLSSLLLPIFSLLLHRRLATGTILNCNLPEALLNVLKAVARKRDAILCSIQKDKQKSHKSEESNLQIANNHVAKGFTTPRTLTEKKDQNSTTLAIHILRLSAKLRSEKDTYTVRDICAW